MIKFKNILAFVLLTLFSFSVISTGFPVAARAQSSIDDTLTKTVGSPLRIVSQLESNDLDPSINPLKNTFSGGTCQGSLVIGWMLCGLVANMYAAIQAFYNFVIIPGLQIDPLSDSSAAGSPEAYVYNVWNSFRVIANIIFIAVFILAIVGQAFSWFFTPYELKKIMPRLVIGAVGIQISWYIVGFMIDLFNVLGAGVRGLVLAPVLGIEDSALNVGPGLGDSASIFQGNPKAMIDLGQALGFDAAAFVGGSLIAASTIIFFGAKGVIMGLVLILLPIVMIVVVASIIIALRKIVVLLLVVTSPLAFAMWILPNTQGIFKQWWELLWKSLLMYPLIVGLIASGLLLSHTLDDADLAGGLKTIIGFIALFAPYALIPATFKFAGNILSTVSGSIQGMDKNFREKILGDPHSPWSFRGRMHEANSNRRMDKIHKFANWASDENRGLIVPKGVMGSTARGALSGLKGAPGAFSSGRGGRKWYNPMGALAGTRAAAAPMIRPLGQLAATTAMKAAPMMMGGKGLGQAIAERNIHMADTVDQLGGINAEILMAIVAGRADAKNFVTGGTIDYAHGLAATGGSGFAFGAEPLVADRAAVQRAFQLLAHRYSTVPEINALRESLFNNSTLKHHIGEKGLEEIWDTFRVSDLADQVYPELRYTNLNGTLKFDATTAEGRRVAREMAERIYDKKELSRGLPQARAGFWDTHYELGEFLAQRDKWSDISAEEAESLDLAAEKYRIQNERIEENVMDEYMQAGFSTKDSNLRTLLRGGTIIDPDTFQPFKLATTGEKTDYGAAIYDLTDKNTRAWLATVGSPYGGPPEGKMAQRNFVYRKQLDRLNQSKADADKLPYEPVRLIDNKVVTQPKPDDSHGGGHH